ncbi:hypothetical protein [uncultured Methylobacterium sp.]|uniref:hypothetical protein n=1 Tax=uncultured Methylobacterium sp. TaxID=157278 RepID=UPI0035CAB3C0
MSDPYQSAYIVKAALADESMPSGFLTLFYAIIADDAESGLQLVKGVVKEDAVVELTDARLSQVTAQAIGLAPGLARAL